MPKFNGLAVAGTVLAAAVGCSPDVGSPEKQVGRVYQAINAVRCDQVTLEAVRSDSHHGTRRGEFSFPDGAMRFALPGEIPVTSGNAGRGEAELVLRKGSIRLECGYRASPGDGSKYVLRRCEAGGEGEDDHDDAGGPKAGDQVEASSFRLEVRSGLAKAGPTAVRLVIDETRPCDPASRGEVHFNDRGLAGLGGNGRSCADCHVASDHLQLSPATAEARFRALESKRQVDPAADDPLFRAIDADDFRTNGAAASDFSNLRQNGLIRITFTLPPKMKLIDPATNLPSSETVVDVWRAVPSVFDVKLSGPDGQLPVWARGPNPQGGFQRDARIATLQQQALNALLDHAQILSPPRPGFLDDLAAFQNGLFSSSGAKALADAVAAGTTPLPDPDPPLDALETQGKAVFVRSCAQCHGGPGLSTPLSPQPPAPPIPRYHDIVSQCPRPIDAADPPRFIFATCSPSLARNARLYEILLIDGTTQRRKSSDPGRALLTGFVGGPGPQDDWQKFDTTSLRGISKTAPYFHNNSAATLEEVLDHYDAFFKRVAILNPSASILTTDGIHRDRPFAPEERRALLAYLRKL
jgi:mono/diheme cytochrome c family protein